FGHQRARLGTGESREIHANCLRRASSRRGWARRRRCLVSSNVRQPTHGVRESLHHANEQRGLSIGLRSPLLPILECPHICAQVSCEESTRKVQFLAKPRKLASGYLWSRLRFDSVRA